MKKLNNEPLCLFWTLFSPWTPAPSRKSSTPAPPHKGARFSKFKQQRSLNTSSFPEGAWTPAPLGRNLTPALFRKRAWTPAPSHKRVINQLFFCEPSISQPPLELLNNTAGYNTPIEPAFFRKSLTPALSQKGAWHRLSFNKQLNNELLLILRLGTLSFLTSAPFQKRA